MSVIAEDTSANHIKVVSETKGLVAFWHFDGAADKPWASKFDPQATDKAYPMYLRRIGDEKRYTQKDWPYTDAKSQLKFDESGPFGHAMYFNQGHLYAEVPRAEFDNGPLDLCGDKAFTLITWAKFTGARHLVAGIWDEGGWDKYRGRRQVALFGGLFGRKGIIAHISGTGAASYPQSEAKGSEYARARALDGGAFENNTWVMMAMSFDPKTRELTAYQNGIATPLKLTDPVELDALNQGAKTSANPYVFKWPVYSPRHFILKYNGYSVKKEGVREHVLEVDAEKKSFTYHQDAVDPKSKGRFKIRIYVQRGSASVLEKPIEEEVTDDKAITFPAKLELKTGDVLKTALLRMDGETWQPVGTEVSYPIPEGAPFTLARALGLGKSEALDHGSVIHIDGGLQSRVIR
jgi:hypothetical protein